MPASCRKRHERETASCDDPALATSEPYYRDDLALVHHRGFGFHADACAPGILALLAPVLDRGGLVLELGCGSGLLTRHLVEAGHRVVATDASPAMLELARDVAPGAEAIRPLVLPDDPLPDCDAVVSVGHVLSYLSDEAAVEAALVAAAAALRPRGVFAIDLCDLLAMARQCVGPRRTRPKPGWVTTGRLSLESLSPERICSSARSRPSFETRTALGDVMTNDTRTSWWTLPRYRRSWLRSVSR